MMRRVLYVARHGETDWNAANRWQGQTDIPLNALGRAQARALAGVLRGAGLSGIVASDLSRAQETAQIVASELAVPVVYVDAGLRERSFGCFEGLTGDECKRLHPEAWRLWKAERRPPEGAETPDELKARVIESIARVAERVATDDAPALVVTHGGAVRAIVAMATGQQGAPVKNGAIWRVGWEGQPVWAEESAGVPP